MMGAIRTIIYSVLVPIFILVFFIDGVALVAFGEPFFPDSQLYPLYELTVAHVGRRVISLFVGIVFLAGSIFAALLVWRALFARPKGTFHEQL